MPFEGSVTAEVGTSLLRLGAVVALVAAAVAAMGLLVGWTASRPGADRSGLRRRKEQERRQVSEKPASAVVPQPRPARPPGRRRPVAGHHPAGRRMPAAQPAAPAPAPAPELLPIGPRRPLQLVASDLRRLTHELAMVPGGMPMARRGLLAAYDDVLIEAAALLQVPHQQLSAEPPATRELERMRLLASLEAAGLVVSG